MGGKGGRQGEGTEGGGKEAREGTERQGEGTEGGGGKQRKEWMAARR